MKVGFNLLLWTTHVTADHVSLLPKLKAAGYDGVEVPLFEGDESHFKNVGMAIRAAGLTCSTVTIMTPEANPISPDAAVRAAAVDRLKWAIEMTAACGGDLLCGPIHSPLALFSGAGPNRDEKHRGADVLRHAAEFAAGQKVTLAVEYLNRFECYFLTTAADTAALVQAVGHPNFLAMYDTFHAHIEEKAVAPALAALKGSLAHVHISENDRGIPGTGQVAWPETFRQLKSMNYQGWLTIEAFGRAMPALAAATKVWRDLFPSDEHVYRDGIKFIQRMWANA